jgi:anaerobic ribonucleoside-triphosphate reductase activating protein
MWSRRGGRDVDVAEILERIDRAIAAHAISGVSVLGGEPLEQADSLAILARGIHVRGLDLMIYSGFTLAELRARADQATGEVLACTDLLVDGRYDRDRPDRARRWVGSENQVVHFLSDRWARDDPSFFGPRSVEIRVRGGLVVVNGWPMREIAPSRLARERDPRA